MSILESIIDYTLKTYSPHVFDDPKSVTPNIKEELRDKILSDTKKIDNIVKVKSVFIKGSILTKRYTNKSDIDVYVQISDISDAISKKNELRELWEQIDDQKYADIPHPLQYYITSKDYNFQNTDAAYDIVTNEWIRREPSKSIDIKDYMDEFREYVEQFSDFTEELRQNMIDYEILKDIPNEQLENLDKLTQDKLSDIEKSIQELNDLYTELKNYRNESFTKEMTPSELKKFGSKNRLPGNVVYKLIERYHYVDLVKKIRRILGNGLNIDEKGFEKLNSLIKTNLIKENVKFSKLYNKPKKVTQWGSMEEFSNYMYNYFQHPKFPKLLTECVFNHNLILESPHKLPIQLSNNLENIDYNIISAKGSMKDKKKIGEFFLIVDNVEVYSDEDPEQTDIDFISTLDPNNPEIVAQFNYTTTGKGDIISKWMWTRKREIGVFHQIFKKYIIPKFKGKTLFSDTGQTPQAMRLWVRIIEEYKDNPNFIVGVYDNATHKYLTYKEIIKSDKTLSDYYGDGLFRYRFYIQIPINITEQSSSREINQPVVFTLLNENVDELINEDGRVCYLLNPNVDGISYNLITLSAEKNKLIPIDVINCNSICSLVKEMKTIGYYPNFNTLVLEKITNSIDNTIINEANVFGITKGRKDMQHKPNHRQQQAVAGLKSQGTRKSLNLLPDYMRKKGKKTEHKLDGAKKYDKEIRVKKDSPEAIYYIKKYQIADPTGTKIVGSNQNSKGVKIIFEDVIGQTIKDIELNINTYVITDLYIPILEKTFNNLKIKAENEVKAVKRVINILLPGELKSRTSEQLKEVIEGDLFKIKKLNK